MLEAGHASSSHMPKFEIRTPIRIDKLTEIMRIKGVPVYLHWSVLLIAILILLNVSEFFVGTAYLGVLLIHESGHLIAAQPMRSEVVSIQLYPIFGITRFEIPWSKFDHCVIAWRGVIAQALVALPIVGWVALFGTRASSQLTPSWPFWDSSAWALRFSISFQYHLWMELLPGRSSRGDKARSLQKPETAAAVEIGRAKRGSTSLGASALTSSLSLPKLAARDSATRT